VRNLVGTFLLMGTIAGLLLGVGVVAVVIGQRRTSLRGPAARPEE